jgi:hypothetical protein
VVFGGGVRLLLGNGDGTFQTIPVSYVAGVGPVSAAVGDFNGDGLPDLAVANFDSGGGVSILFLFYVCRARAPSTFSTTRTRQFDTLFLIP